MQKKINVAFFTDSYLPNKDGVVFVIELLRTYLPLYNVNVKVIISPNVLFSVPLPFYKDYKFAFIIPSQAEKILRENNIDALHNHGLGLTALASVIAAKKLGIKKIITFHTNVVDATHYLGILEKPAKYIITKYLRWLFNMHDIIIALSEKSKNMLIDIGVKKPILVLPTGIEIEKIRMQKKKSRAARKKINDRIRILFVGRVVKEKNIDALIECINKSALKDRIELLIVGDGPYMNELKEKSPPYVKFYGWLDKEKLNYFYKNADVLAFPSLFDTQGLVVFEAIANRLPILALKGTSAEEYAKHYGSIFTSCNDFDIALKKAIKKNITNIPKFIDIKETCKKYAEIYK
ncbi:MAG: glycosyltransferase [Candidatus Anstonellales archaeon]